MSRREDRRKARQTEALVRAGAALLLLIALGAGGITHFVPVLITLITGLIGLGVIGGLAYLAYKFHQAKKAENTQFAPYVSTPMRNVTPPYQAASAPPPVKPEWDRARIEKALGEIDWYQFEKFCAALLRSEGFSVERKGGAQPDGGVDLVATKNGESTLVQCKHWKTWTVQERVIRELLGSMTHFQVKRGALYVLKGATRPAESFARQHGIEIASGADLSSRAKAALSYEQLSSLLKAGDPHCPKCESPMVWRTGDFAPFWGCSTYSRCRGILKQSGAR